MSKKEDKLDYLAEQKLKAEIDKLKAEKAKAVADANKAIADSEVVKLSTKSRWYLKKEFWFGLAAALAGLITAGTTMLQFDSKLESQRSGFQLELAKSEREGSKIARESTKIEREMLKTEEQLASKEKEFQEMQTQHQAMLEQSKHASKLLSSSKKQVRLAEQRLEIARKRLESIDQQNQRLATEKSELVSRIEELKKKKRIAESDYESVIGKINIPASKLTVVRNLNDCVYVDDGLITVGDGGVILMHKDGNWISSNSGTSSNLNSVTNSSGRIIIAGNGQTLISKYLSDFGDSTKKWNSHLTTEGEIDFYDAKLIDQQIVAVGSHGAVYVNEFGMPLEKLEYPEWSFTSLAISKNRLCIVGKGPMADFTKPTPNPISDVQVAGFFMSRNSSRIRINDRDRWFWSNGIGIVTIRDIWSNSVDLGQWLNEGPKSFEIRQVCSSESDVPNQLNQFFWGVATDGTLFLHVAASNKNFLYSTPIAKDAPTDATGITVVSHDKKLTELYVTGSKGIYRVSVEIAHGEFGGIDASGELLFEQLGLNAITVGTDGKTFAVGQNGLAVAESDGQWRIIPLNSIRDKDSN